METQKSDSTIKSEGHVTCLPPDNLCGVVNEIFKELIGKLSFPEITAQNCLEKLSKTCKTYMLSSDTPVREGGRRRSFRISARPRGLCVKLLYIIKRDNVTY